VRFAHVHTTRVVFEIVNSIVSLRVAESVEQEGLDIPEFGMLAYPEDAVSEIR
jgi:ammonia channel protein AmtB